MIGLPNASPNGLLTPCLQSPLAIEGDKYGVGVQVRLTAGPRQLHLVQQKPGLLKIPVHTKNGNEGVVALDIGLAMELLHPIEEIESGFGKTVLAQCGNQGSDSGGGD